MCGVEAVAEGTFRVRLSPSGEAFEEPPFSYAIAPGALDDLPETDVREDEDAIRVQHGSGVAVIERRPLRISFEDAGHRFGRRQLADVLERRPGDGLERAQGR